MELVETHFSKEKKDQIDRPIFLVMLGALIFLFSLIIDPSRKRVSSDFVIILCIVVISWGLVFLIRPHLHRTRELWIKRFENHQRPLLSPDQVLLYDLEVFGLTFFSLVLYMMLGARNQTVQYILLYFISALIIFSVISFKIAKSDQEMGFYLLRNMLIEGVVSLGLLPLLFHFINLIGSDFLYRIELFVFLFGVSYFQSYLMAPFYPVSSNSNNVEPVNQQTFSKKARFVFKFFLNTLLLLPLFVVYFILYFE